MKCGQCGAELEPGARFCSRCGTPVAPPAPSEPTPAYVPPVPAAREPIPRFAVGLGVLGAALLVLACVLGGAAIYLLRGKPGVAVPALGITGTPAPGETPAPTVAATTVAEPTPTVAATTVVQPTPTVPAPAGPEEVISFYSNRDGNWEIYVMSPDGSNIRRLSSNEALDAALVWSPDGQRATFTSERTGDREVYVMNADGTGLTNLSNNPATDSDASWSPDGSKLAFESSRREGDWDIWVMNADGSNPVNLTNTEGGDGKAVWSPDGTKIAFESARDGNVEVYVMNADGSGQTNLTNNPAKDSVPRWSPDGSQIAFKTDRDGNWEVYIMNADGSNPVNLTNNPADDGNPIWSPDGARIAFTSNRGDEFTIHIMQRDGSNVVAVTDVGADWASDWSVVKLAAAPAPTQPPTAGFALPYSDDFSDPESGWEVSSDEKRIKEYKDGEYHINIIVDDLTTWSFLPDATLGDFTAEVDIRQVSDVEDDAGALLFRYVDGDNWYRVAISPLGTFSVMKRVEGNYIYIQRWTESPAILTGQATNHLKVTCKGDQIAVFVNGQHLTTVRDLAFEEGRIALYGMAWKDKPNAHVAFDNLKLTAAEDVPPPLLGPLPLTDDFSDPESGWPTADDENVVWEYRGGIYYFTQKKANLLNRAILPDKIYDDFTLEVDATPVGGPEAGYYGVVFRYVDSNNQYMFRVSADGRIRLQKKVAGEYSDLLPWEESSAVNAGQATNHLKVICQATQCTAYVNDQQVATFSDDAFLQGKIGFVVGNPEEAGGTEVEFDNLTVSAP